MLVDKNTLPYSQLSGTNRKNCLKSLNSARSLLHTDHPANSHLVACGKALGFEDIKDRSEDNSGKPGDRTSPGTISPSTLRPPDNSPRAIATTPSSRVGGSSGPMPGPGGKAAKRDEAVLSLYKAAAKEKNPELKKRLEGLAFALDRLELNDVEKMSAVDLECLKGEHGPEATKAALAKMQATIAPFQELVAGANKGKNNFQSRHGF